MNRFAVLDVSDNEDEQPKAVAAKKGTGKDSKDTSATKANAKPVTDKKEVQAPKAPKIIPGLPPKEVKKPNAPSQAAAPPVKEEVNEAESGKDNNRGGRPRGKDGRRGEHKGRGNNSGEGEGRRKREFDRKSGTGRGREVSRGGRGSFGFGNVDQDALDAEKHPNEAQDVLEPVDAANEVVENDDAAAAETPADSEPATLTLDEFMQKREEARQRVGSLLAEDKPVRKVDTTVFQGLVEKADDLDNYIPGKGSKSQTASKKEKTSSKQVLDVNFKFQQNAVPEERGFRRGGERDRGGRGRGGRGEGKRHDRKTETPQFSSQDFPSL